MPPLYVVVVRTMQLYTVVKGSTGKRCIWFSISCTTYARARLIVHHFYGNSKNQTLRLILGDDLNSGEYGIQSCTF